MRLRNKLLRMAYLLAHPCVDCHESDPLVLEFDHYGKKRAAIATMIKQVTWTAVEKEIAVCEVRCANCHRRKTLRDLGWPDYMAMADSLMRPPVPTRPVPGR